VRYGILVLILAISVALVYAFSARAQSPRPHEYKVVLGSYISAGAIQSGIQSNLNEQAQAGWEFVQMMTVPGGLSSTYVFVFRR